MKHSTNNLKTVFTNSIVKIAFCTQLMIASLAVPFLYYVGVTTSTGTQPEKHVRVITNKGKKVMAADEKTEAREQSVSLGFLHI